MPHPATAPDAVTTTGGFLLVLAIVVPVAGALLAFVVGGRYIERIAFAVIYISAATRQASSVRTVESANL